MGRDCIGQLLRNEPAALAGEAEAFHQMRVALRRLRSALAAVRSTLPPDHYRQALDELKWLASSLEAARNWDAFTTGLLAPVRDALPEDADLKRLVEAAKRRRRAAYDSAKEAIGSRRYAASILNLARWFEARGWREQKASAQSAPLFLPIAEVAPRLIERRWRQVRKRSRHFAKLPLAERHELRIALKKLRYVIEFLGPLFDAGAVKSVLRRVKPLQEELGHLNDVCTAQDLDQARSRGPPRAMPPRSAAMPGWCSAGISAALRTKSRSSAATCAACAAPRLSGNRPSRFLLTTAAAPNNASVIARSESDEAIPRKIASARARNDSGLKGRPRIAPSCPSFATGRRGEAPRSRRSLCV